MSTHPLAGAVVRRANKQCIIKSIVSSMHCTDALGSRQTPALYNPWSRIGLHFIAAGKRGMEKADLHYEISNLVSL